MMHRAERTAMGATSGGQDHGIAPLKIVRVIRRQQLSCVKGEGVEIADSTHPIFPREKLFPFAEKDIVDGVRGEQRVRICGGVMSAGGDGYSGQGLTEGLGRFNHLIEI